MIKRIFILIISSGIFLLDQVLHAIFLIFKIRPQPKCIVIYYHTVSKKDLSNFYRQMSCLIRHTKPVASLNQNIQPNVIQYSLLTFDDAFNSVLKNAIPILNNLAIPFIIFAPTKYLGKRPLWVKYIDNSIVKKELVLTSSEIYRLSLNNNLITFGSHTVSHPRLSECSDFKLSSELINSKQNIEDITGRPCSYLSFPYGDHNQKVIDAAKMANYQNCFSIIPSLYFYPVNNFVVGRTEILTTDWIIEFFLKIKGSYRWLPYAYKIKEFLKR
jgi:peptidoglycan/xylan/chitin deacetylase (PgdA/CDA1 family)